MASTQRQQSTTRKQRVKSGLGEVTGEALASVQPCPLAQHLGHKQMMVSFYHYT